MAARAKAKARQEDLVELLTIGGEEWLRFKPLKFDIAFLRGTTADENGNITMEQEAIFGEQLSMAQATSAMAASWSCKSSAWRAPARCKPKDVKIPGIIVDYVIVDPEQKQTFHTDYDPTYAGEMRGPLTSIEADAVHRPARSWRAARRWSSSPARSAISAPASRPASRRWRRKKASSIASSLTNEQGFIGGAPVTGPDSGAAQNYDALVDQRLPVRFLRRRRARYRLPLVRRSRPVRQRQCQPLCRQDHRRRRLYQYQPERQKSDLQRHLHGGRP